MSRVQRSVVLARIASYLSERRVGHPLRVGVDGICGVGKTTFARELAAAVGATGRPVVLLDSDGFHNPAAIRRRGTDPARGYYLDAYDFRSLINRVLLPLGPGGDLVYASKVHDLATDRTVSETATAARDAVLIMDCTFLQRGALRDHWEEMIFLDAQLSSAEQRGVGRDAEALGGADRARAAYSSRYMAACRLYLAEERPRERASIVVDHDDPGCPEIIRAPFLDGPS